MTTTNLTANDTIVIQTTGSDGYHVTTEWDTIDLVVEVNWDDQDPSNAGWAYRIQLEDHFCSGPIDDFTTDEVLSVIGFELGRNWFINANRTIRIVVGDAG